MAAKNKKLTYDELYCLYHNYVVLMLKTFMYTAYDDSARILSYLMDYKLCDTLDGLYCAGPDKEKISSVLSAHHVNHIISEFGENNSSFVHSTTPFLATITRKLSASS